MGRIRVIGNGALSGAVMLLLSRDLENKATQLAQSARVVTLSANPVFADLYMEGMLFEN